MASPIGFVHRLLMDSEKDLPLYHQSSKTTQFDAVTRHTNLERPTQTQNELSSCIEITPYDNHPMPYRLGETLIPLENYSAPTIKAYGFHPHFSGLYGPKIQLIRHDTKALLRNKGTSSQLFHNAKISSETPNIACDTGINITEGIFINHRLDTNNLATDPLIRSKITSQTRFHFMGFMVGTMAISIPLYDNLEKDNRLTSLENDHPIRQDNLAFTWKDVQVDRLMLSAFYTPKSNFYTALHAGYLEEMFLGVGGEILYRPWTSNWALGGEAWHSVKRMPSTSLMGDLDDQNTQTSAFINAYYTMETRPIMMGLSLGRFLDGDYGGTISARYTPAYNWSIEGYSQYSTETDKYADNNWTFGMRAAMPLGQFKHINANSRQTIEVTPIASDKGQKIDNPYPLYDLTNAWSAQNIYRHWDTIDITQ